MTDSERSAARPDAVRIKNQAPTPPRKHEADRRYERRTVLIAATLASAVAMIAAGISYVGLRWSVHEASARDSRDFVRQQGNTAISAWLDTVGALDRAEINATTIVTSGPPSTASSETARIELQTDVLKLAQQTSSLRLYVSQGTYVAASRVATLQSDFLNLLLNPQCADAKSLPPSCGKPTPLQDMLNTEDQVARLLQADLNKLNRSK
jgi:hypothetical protein